jgi:hypothetical protein
MYAAILEGLKRSAGRSLIYFVNSFDRSDALSTSSPEIIVWEEPRLAPKILKTGVFEAAVSSSTVSTWKAVRNRRHIVPSMSIVTR